MGTRSNLSLSKLSIVEFVEAYCPITGEFYTAIPYYLTQDYDRLDFYCTSCYNRHIYRKEKMGASVRTVKYRTKNTVSSM